MLGGLGMGELTIILVIVIVVFGATRLPKIGAGLGRGIQNFKKEVKEEDKKKLEPSAQDSKSQEKTSQELEGIKEEN